MQSVRSIMWMKKTKQTNGNNSNKRKENDMYLVINNYGVIFYLTVSEV